MAERYSRVFSLPTERYAPGCPVVLAAGALLKDAVTGGVVAQLIFRNISGKTIIGMKVRITPFDLAGKQLGDAEQNYLDMTVPYGVEFGQKTAVYLPDASARKYEVMVTQVVFADSAVLEREFSDWQPLPDKIPLDTWLGSKEMAKQYRLQFGEDCAYQPQKEEAVWLCSCGSVNPAENQSCAQCGKTVDALLSADLDALKADMDARLEQERLEAEARAAERKRREEERVKQREEEAAAARKKKLIITAIVAAVLAVVILWFAVISPAIAYNNALKLEAEGNYAEALHAFYSARGYMDSREHIRKLQPYFADCISAGSAHTVGLKSDGTVVAVGSNKDGQCNVSSWTDIVAVSAGDYHTVGLKADGTVVAVGSNKDGQCNVSSWTDIVAVSADWVHTVGLKTDGTVVAVGYNESGQCDVSSWRDIVAVSAGYYHTVGLKADGTVVAVGSNWDDQCDVSSWRDIVAVSAGNVHSVGLKADGTVVAVGDNGDGQCDVSDWKNIVAISAGFGHTVGLRSDGTVVAVGWNGYGQCDVSSWRDIVAVSASDYHTVGLKADGTVVAVGSNAFGQCDVSSWRGIGPCK